MDHKQNVIPFKNSFVYDNSASRTWDMHFNWLRDRSFKQGARTFLDNGKNTHANNFTKYYPPVQHRMIRPNYILHNHNLS